MSLSRSRKSAWFLMTGLCFCWVTACAARMPSQPRTVTILRKHFDRYGKKFPESPFGNKKIRNVEILETGEIHKGLVYAVAFVTIEGPEVFKIRMTLEKKSFGWRTVYWENLSGN